MSRNKGINAYQAEILATALSAPLYEGKRVPWTAMFVPATWSHQIRPLVKRGFLSEGRRNMFDVTAEGEAAYRAYVASAQPQGEERS